MTPQVKLVTATRLSRADFWAKSLLGRSLRVLPAHHGLDIIVHADNRGAERHGLPALYNRHLDSGDDRLTVFLHDDVFVHDIFLAERVREALREHDIAGLAGSRYSAPEEPSWALSFDEELRYRGWQTGPGFQGVTLSGVVSHLTGPDDGSIPRVQPSSYGPTPATVDCLDGLFLAVKPAALRQVALRFDEAFDFHLYDVDFTRCAAARGLSLTTWPILCTHGSSGNYGSESWKAAARRYREQRRAVVPPAAAPLTREVAPSTP